MRKRDNKQSSQENEPRIKKILEDERHSRKGFVEWRINKDDIDYILKHYKTEVSIYRIKTRKFSKDLCKRYEILRTLNNRWLAGYKNLQRPLKKYEKGILDTNNVSYEPYVLRIFLQRIIKI